MRKIRRLRCVECGRTYAYGEVEYTCPACGIRGILDVEFDYDAIEADGFGREALAARGEQSIWRYFELLPVARRESVPTLQLGLTPVYRFPALGRELGVRELLVKDEGRLPTGSFKDRASAVGAARARELGYAEVTCASTGNAASSFAGMCANLGLGAHIFVPASAPEAKLAQLLVYGADLLLVDGSYDEAYYLCMEAAEAFGWYNRNCAINPYLVEGKKTCGLEIGEQLGTDLPDWVAVAVGDGCTVAGIWKGLKEMRRFGVIDRLPRLLGVQATGANPIYEAFCCGSEAIERQVARTAIDSIAVGQPRNAVKALRAIRESGGAVVEIADEEALENIRFLAARTGVFAEPAGATPLAGIRRAVAAGTIGHDERVLQVVTGNGLKDVRGALRGARLPAPLPVSLDAVRAAVGAR